MSFNPYGFPQANTGTFAQNFAFGHMPGFQYAPSMTPQQMQFQNQMLGGMQQPTQQGLQYLQNILGQDPETMAQFEQPYKRQFEQETVPMIAERFGGSLGTHGAKGSSAMGQQMARGGRELSENLASLRGQLGMQALQQLQGLYGQAFQPQFQPTYDPGAYGVFGGLLAGMGQGIGAGMKGGF